MAEGREAEALRVVDEQRRDGRRAAVVQQHGAEVVPPDAPQRQAVRQRRDPRVEAAVHEEVAEREGGQRQQFPADVGRVRWRAGVPRAPRTRARPGRGRARAPSC